jgi:hypothetical protein
MVMISISFFVFCSPSTLNTVTFKAAKGGSLQQPGYTLRLISMKTVQNNWEMVGHWSWYVSFSHPFSLWLVSNTWATPAECLQHGLTVPNRPIICQNEHWSCRPFWLLLAPRSIGAFICFLNRKTPPSGHWPWGNSGSKPESQMASHVLFPQFSDKQTDHSRIIPWNPMESHGIPWNPGISRIACRVLAACNGLMVSSAPNGCGKTDWWMVAEWCGFRRDTFQVWGFIQDAYLVHPCSATNREIVNLWPEWPVGSNMFQHVPTKSENMFGQSWSPWHHRGFYLGLTPSDVVISTWGILGSNE